MEGWFGPKNPKLSHGGLVLGEGNPIMAGYAGIEVQGGHKKGLVWAKKDKQKLSHGGSVLAGEMQGGSFWGRGTLLEQGTLGLRCREGVIR